jgi:ParB family transcriptional regulator, chromosome partitioning protein
MKRSRALGRGLESLLPSVEAEGENTGKPAMIAVELIDPNPFQPRVDWDDSELESLAASIKEQGILQPLVMRAAGERYQLIAGERRLRASQLAALSQVPAYVREADDRQMMALALVENIQRQDLNPMEKAEAFSRFCREFSITQEELGRQVGLSRSAVANFQRLMDLPAQVKDMVRNGSLSMGHGRTLLGLENPEAMIRYAKMTLARGYSVRSLEEAVRKKASRGKASRKAPVQGIPEIRMLETELERCLGTRVRVKDRTGRGRLEIEYTSLDELDRILNIIRGR